MTMHQPGQPSSGGQVIPMLVFTVLGAIGITVGIVVLLFMLQGPGAPAAAPPAPRQASLARAVPPAASPPIVYTPSAGVGRPLPMPPQGHQAVAKREPNGHFFFDTAVSGITIRMMFDTGASIVALRAEDAAHAGIAVNGLNYSITINTANGTTTAAPVMLDAFRVGDIIRYNVQAIVSSPGQLNVSLLGQSFMSKLNGYRFEGSELILQGD